MAESRVAHIRTQTHTSMDQDHGTHSQDISASVGYLEWPCKKTASSGNHYKQMRMPIVCVLHSITLCGVHCKVKYAHLPAYLCVFYLEASLWTNQLPCGAFTNLHRFASRHSVSCQFCDFCHGAMRIHVPWRRADWCSVVIKCVDSNLAQCPRILVFTQQKMKIFVNHWNGMGANLVSYWGKEASVVDVVQVPDSSEHLPWHIVTWAALCKRSV